MKWTNGEIIYLEEYYGKLNIEELKNILNHSVGSIRVKASKLNLTKKKKHSFWIGEELIFLKENYPDGDLDLLRLNLNRHTNESIKNKANSMSLKRNGMPINGDFFKEWTPKMAWTFGLWIADGYMT